jgi:hypothetical protein
MSASGIALSATTSRRRRHEVLEDAGNRRPNLPQYRYGSISSSGNALNTLGMFAGAA